MRFSFIFTCLFFLQACTLSQNFANAAKTDTSLFPYQRAEIPTISPFGNAGDKIVLTKKAEQSFVYLALEEAIRNDDYEKVVEASHALLRLYPNSLMIGDAASWLLSSGHPKDTKELLEAAVRAMPEELAMYVMLSEAILLNNDKDPEAIRVLQSFIDKNPNVYVAQMELGLTYLKIGKPKDAYELFNALPETEKTPMVLYYMGYSLRKMGRIDEAVSMLKKSLQQSPDFMECILDLAQIEESRKNYSEARKYYEQILEFDVYNQDVLLHLVSIALKQGNPERALEIAQKKSNSFAFVVSAAAMLMQDKRPDLVETLLTNLNSQEDISDELRRELLYLQGALAYEGMKNYNKALSFLNQLNKDDKYYKNSLDIKVQIFLEQDLADEAIKTLKHALSIYTKPEDNKSFLSMLYQIYLFQSNHEAAAPILKQYLENNPNDFDAAFRYAYVQAQIGEKDQALKLMEKLLLKEPDNYDVLNFIGYTLVENKKRLKYAFELLYKANSLKPDADYILDSLAWAYYQEENYLKAWEYIQKAILNIKKNSPQDPTMWDHYGDIARAIKNIEEAKYGYTKSLEIKVDDEVQKKLNGL